MKTMFAIAMVLVSSAGAMAADEYSDYTTYYSTDPMPAARPKARASRGKHDRVQPIDTRRYGDDRVSRNPDNLAPGFRAPTGIYVPPEYSTNPRSPSQDGFGPSASPFTSSLSPPNPFVGPLGTRR